MLALLALILVRVRRVAVPADGRCAAGAPLLLAVASAFTLLAEAMVAVALARNWHASWWEWHLLMLMAFGAIAYSARREDGEERFSDLYLDQTAAGKREVSVMFADLEGFTSLLRGARPARGLGDAERLLRAWRSRRSSASTAARSTA